MEKRKHNVLLCILAGTALPFAFSPYDFLLVALISPAILFYLWIKASPKSAFIYGYAFGFGQFGFGVNWLHISINLFGGVNLAGALFITYLLVAFLALYPALVGYITQKYFHTNDSIKLMLVIPALWTFLEWCRSWILTGIPWLNLGYSQIDSFLSGLAPITGVYGISFFVCLSAAGLVTLYFSTRTGKLIIITTLILVWSIAGSIQNINWTESEDREITVALIQGAIPQELKWKKEQRQYTRDLYLSLSEPFWDRDLIIWPETAIPAFYHLADDFTEPLTKLAREHNAELLTGIPVKDQDLYYNAIASINHDTNFYYKRHLVPFGEYLPFDRWLRPFFNFLQIPMSDFSAGKTDNPLLTAAGVKIGVSICYEDTFGEEVIDAMPDAGLLVNISNDAWFGDSIAPHQHLQMARMRSMETGRYMLRATNTGISAIIDEKGNIISRSPQFTPHALSEKVRVFKGTTPYASYGNTPVIVFMLVLLLIMIIRGKKTNSDLP